MRIWSGPHRKTVVRVRSGVVNIVNARIHRGYTPPTPLSLAQPDYGILRKAQRGDERAFTILVRAYEVPVFNYVLRLVGDRALAEDLTQEVFLRVFKGLPRFSFRSSFTTWLFQVTKNRVMDELRARERPVAVGQPENVVEDRLLVRSHDDRERPLVTLLGFAEDCLIRLGERQGGRRVATAFPGVTDAVGSSSSQTPKPTEPR